MKRQTEGPREVKATVYLLGGPSLTFPNNMDNHKHPGQAKKSGSERRLKHRIRARYRNRKPRVRNGRIINRPIVEIVP